MADFSIHLSFKYKQYQNANIVTFVYYRKTRLLSLSIQEMEGLRKVMEKQEQELKTVREQMKKMQLTNVVTKMEMKETKETRETRTTQVCKVL